MTSRKLKKSLQRDLRAKRNNKHRPRLIGGGLLFLLLAGGIYLIWNQQRPAALLQQGLRLEQQKQLEPALEIYRTLYQNYQASPEAGDALFRSGQILQHDLAEDQRALLNYLLLEKDHPRSEHLLAARREAADLTKYRLKDCTQAVPLYQRLIEQSSDRADRYLYEIADCYARQENWSQAAIEFEALGETYPRSELGQLASYRLANALLLSGQRAEARSRFEKLANEEDHSQLVEEARFRLAEMLEEDERLREALKAYSLLTHYPRQDLLKQKILKLKERMARKKKVL